MSIGLPVYNGSSYIREAIDAILAQTYEDFELIISDNASTDNTPDILQAYAVADPRIQIYRNPQNMGAAWNYNRVFALARGEYFKWAAHDDVIAPTFLEECLSVLDRDASLVLCYAKTGRLNELGELSGEYIHPLRIDSASPWVRFRDLVLIDHNCVGVFGLIRRRVLAKTPLIAAYVGSDRVLLAELGLRGCFCEIPQRLFFRRNHPQTSVRTYNEYERAIWFDPRKGDQLTFPNWRKGWEYLRCIARVRPGWKDGLLSMAVVALWFKNYRKRLAMDLSMAFHRLRPDRSRPDRSRPAKT